MDFEGGPHDWEWEDADDGELTKQQARQELADLIVDLKTSGNISAKTGCLLSWWAHHAGATGFVESLMFRPDSETTGHYSRHWDHALGTRTSGENWYELEVPMYRRASASRVAVDMSCLPPHEVFGQEFGAAEDLPAKLKQAIDSKELPLRYHQHPVVMSAPADVPVYPVALYLDAVQFTRTDTVLGVWMYCLLTNVHHCLMVLRKSEMCRCGCRKWCSLWPVFQLLHWSNVAMSTGLHPSRRHDGTIWNESDAARAVLAGQNLGWRAAVVFIKADWAELASTLGFSPWNHSIHPCLFCHTPREGLYTVQGLSPVSFPHPLRTWDDYQQACGRCEIERVVTEAERPLLLGSLVYDKRADTSAPHGRAMVVDCLGLRKGDRVEPSLELPDVSKLDTVQCPIKVTFWRSSEQAGVKHRNPLFSTLTGIQPDSAICIDWLHSCSLGIFKDFLGSFICQLFHVDQVFCKIPNIDVRSALSAASLQALLFQFYSSEAKHNRMHTRVQHMEASMFGSQNAPAFNFHGAEVNGFLDFSVQLAVKFRASMSRHQEWLRCAELLVRIKTLIYEFRFRFPARRIQEFHRCKKVCVRMYMCMCL
jgi:hypothetical protein